MMTFKQSRVVGKQQCPACASAGNDRSRDNLILYSDGGNHCFSCGYHNGGTKQITIAKSSTLPSTIDYNIPVDAETALPAIAIQWLNKYHFKLADIIQNRILWSNNMQWLIFPIATATNQIVGFQARNFDTSKPYKWFTRFNKSLYVITHGAHPTIVLVEDVVSAIRCSLYATAIPLFGSEVTTKIVKYLKDSNMPVKLWLDMDKATHSIKLSNSWRSKGIMSSSIITPLDPKEYSPTEIRDILKYD